MTDRLVCGRCGAEGHPPEVRDTIADLEREARLEGRRHAGARYAVETRCRSCREAVRPKRETS